MENKLSSVLATPIPLDVEYKGLKFTLHFNRVGIAHNELFRKRWGPDGVDKALANINLHVISEMLFMLLPKEEKEKLDEPEFVKAFMDYDHEDNEVNIAPLRVDRLRYILGSFSETTMELVFAVFGTNIKQINALNEELNQMPEDKKKETLAFLKGMTGH